MLSGLLEWGTPSCRAPNPLETRVRTAFRVKHFSPSLTFLRETEGRDPGSPNEIKHFWVELGSIWARVLDPECDPRVSTSRNISASPPLHLECPKMGRNL